MPTSLPPDDDDEIVDVEAFLKEKETNSRPAPPPTPIPLGGEYEVEGGILDAEPAPPIPRAPIAPSHPRKKAPEPAFDEREEDDDDDKPRARRRAEIEDDDEPRTRRGDDDEPRVSETWSRWGEWGSTILLLLAAGIGLVILVYAVGSAAGLGPAFLVLVVGGAGWVLLTYPIAVTLERPIRMTPEQAAKDYYGALSHHFPHFRRMWLMLSDEGRNDPEFSSYSDFRAYWKRKLADLRGTQIKGTTPLAFEIAEFKAEKSAGLKTIDAKYTLNVRPRGDDPKPIESARIATTLAKGPDNHWYLDSGTIPKKEAARRGRSGDMVSD